MKDKNMPPEARLFLFFTWDVSLKVWEEKGLFDREIKFYQELVKKGIDVTFLSWGGKEDAEIAKRLAPEIKTISLYNHIPRPKNKALRALCSLMVPFVLKSELKSADIYKSNQMWGGWVPAFTKLLYKKPFIARSGFELYDFTVKQRHSALRQNFIKLLSRMTYNLADRICLATQQDKEFVCKTFAQSEAKIAVHPNWIKTQSFKPEALTQKSNHILFVGRLSEQKNLPLLFEALKDTDISLDIYGVGEEEKHLKSISKNINLKVNFKESVSNTELPKIYNSYPVFVLPSHYEGNPKTLLEAMSCGTAVIGTDVPGIQSVIKHGQNGILVTPEAEPLKNEIRILMSDKDMRTKLAKAARAYIVKEHALDKLIEKELACYELLKEKP